MLKKIKKFTRSPGVFLRDYFNKKYPKIYNEILCPKEEEAILLKYDIELEKAIDIRFSIDVVFTWVNDNDFKWQNKYKKYKDVDLDNYGQYATDNARFNNHNELYYSIQGVKKNIPWVRHIYIVTDDQKPEWLDEFDCVSIIDHKDIIPDKFLPTFNSHVIEAYLHKISGLSEHFIYFNDDVFVARPLYPGHFFKNEKITSLFLSQKSLSTMKSRGVVTPTLSASFNTKKILKYKFDDEIDTPLVHTYVPLRKSMFEEVWCIYSDEINTFLINKFRSNNDLNLATFLVPWFTYCSGEAVFTRDICYYFNIRSPVAKHYYSALKNRSSEDSPHSFCANDFTTTTKCISDYQQNLIEKLKSYYDNEKSQ